MGMAAEVQAGSREARAETRRAMAVDAAIEVLAGRGGRGLTHREVDRHLDWPAGSTSNYFRRREDLVMAVGARLMARDLDDFAEALEGDRRRGRLSVDDAVDLFVRLFRRWMEPEHHIRSLARLEILVERVRHPALRRVTDGAIAAVIAQIEEFFCRIGAPDPRRSAKTFAQLLTGIHLMIAQREQSLSDRTLRALVANWLRISIDTTDT
jgi:DNA-binding transcriptional regulator YbjK